MANRVAAIVPAAGQARRFGTQGNKVYAALGDKPVLAHVLAMLTATAVIDEIAIVAGQHELAQARALVARYGFTKVRTVIGGGASRQESVANGINAISPEAGLVVIHDGARPLCTPGLIERVTVAARQHGAATAAVPLVDTIAAVAGDRLAGTMLRDGLRAIQTPQAFRRDIIQAAHERAQTDGYQGTDDASLVERLGLPVAIVAGERRNIKITTPDDLAVAGHWLKETGAMETRTGMGYDVHRCEPGRPLTLGGLTIPADIGLLGHSDADVIVHALMDALLGAAVLGDIGQLFPNTDPRYAGADSVGLLREVVARLAGAGWAPEHVDVTLIMERPKIAPHVPEMRRVLAAALGLSDDAVSIKATTNEGLGALGRVEGAAALAVATIRRVG
ncbi:MAG: 2-C-methyl-D-erythritol 4-phosphate cytidylyltransferase [Chloroflexota bacterium]